MTSLTAPKNLIHLYLPELAVKSRFSRFIMWCAGQDETHHIGWVGISITTMTAVFFPLTMAAILFNGASFGLIILAMISLTGVVITNLAALPTRYTIPSYVLGITIDLIAVGISFT